MRKFIAVLLSLVMVMLFFCCTAVAQTPERSHACYGRKKILMDYKLDNVNVLENSEMKINSQYQFAYSEKNSENSFTRKYVKDGDNIFKNIFGVDIDQSCERTAQILRSLGMEDAFVEKLSKEKLEKYQECESITSTVVYMKTDNNGITEHVTEEEAFSNATTYGIGGLPTQVIMPDGGSGYPTYKETLEDEYMKIVFVVAEEGDGNYSFSVDATWLTMPFYRMSDSLGACAQNMTIENYTRTGWYSYEQMVC